MLKRLLCLLLVLCCVAPLALGEEASASFRGWNKKEKYQYVIMGSYPESAEGEVAPLMWRVLTVNEEDNTALLLTELIIDMYPVIWVDDRKDSQNRNYRRINNIEESDLYVWMNDTMTHTIFPDEYLPCLVGGDRGTIFVLNRKEMCNPNYGFTKSVYGEQPTRQCKCTAYAKERGVFVGNNHCSTYWVSDIKGPKHYYMSVVGYNGHISYAGYARQNVGVRPACLLKMDTVHFASGSGTKEDPYIIEVNEGVTAEPAEEQPAEAEEAPAA